MLYRKGQYFYIFIGSAILAFGLYHVHSISNITEGGVLGLTLLFEHWFHLSPAISGFVMNLFCFLLGFKVLGKRFILNSIFSTICFSLVYAIVEQFDPLWPELAHMPLVASILGAIFIGVGAGICVKMFAAQSGDDALAMSLSKLFGLKVQHVYLISDLTVLVLSLSYIPLSQMIYSLLTVLLSGQIIGWIQLLEK